MDRIKNENLKSKNVSTNIIMFFIAFLIFLILFAPTVIQYIKVIPLLVLIGISFIVVIKKMRIPIHYRVLLWIVIYVAINFLYLIKGTYDNLEVFKQLLPVNVIWPLLYTLALIIPTSKIKKVDFSKSFVVSTLLIEIFILYIYFNFIGLLPSLPLLTLPLGQRINYNFGYINLFLPSITSLFFLLPYIVSILLVNKNKKKKTIYYVVLLIFGVIISLIAGRRALIAVVAASPFISFFWSKLIRNTNTKYTKIIVLTIVMFFISLAFLSSVDVGLRLQNLNTDLIQSGTNVRTEQFRSLIEGWKKAPLFGVGLGVNADIVRSNTVPGAYELSYIAKLFHTGIVGIIIYFYMIFWMIRKLIIFARQNHERVAYIIPLLTGLASLMLAESTNPYISSFDGMWVLFYALAIINNIYLKNSKRKI